MDRIERTLAICTLLFFVPLVVGAQEPRDVFPEGFVSERVLSVEEGWPTGVAFGRGERIFVTVKRGIVLSYRGDSAPEVFLDITAKVNQYGDRGLLGVTLDPEFPAKPYVYLVYNYDPPELPGVRFSPDGPDGKGARLSRVARVEADAAHDFRVAVPDSETVLLGKHGGFEQIGDPASQDGPPSCDDGTGTAETPGSPVDDCIPADGSSHSIGTVIFGEDGALWVGNGDSSRWTDVDPRALRTLDPSSLAGKILRIDPATGEGLPDNPFYDGDPGSNRSRVWSMGLRNPFRFALHPETGEPFIGDAGWESWEELNHGRGRNFGWPCYEGNDEGNLRQPGYEHNELTAQRCAELYEMEPDAVAAPLYSYPRDTRSTAIIAGDFYTGSSWPEEYRGALFIADHNRQEMSFVRFDEGHLVEVVPFGQGTSSIVQILQGPDTNLYYLILGDRNELRRLRWTGSGNQPPTAVAEASPTEGDPPLQVSFSSSSSFDPDGDELTFNWDFGDGAVSAVPDPVHTFTTSGAYRVALEVSDPEEVKGTDSLVIIVGDTTPSAEIQAPLPGTTYSIGETISFQGSAFDHQDGDLVGESLTWELILHHADHVHRNVFAANGTTGSFVVEDHGDDTWRELILTAVDGSGLSASTSVGLHPKTVPVRFETDPSGLDLVYHGSSFTAPFTATAVVGSERQVHAPLIQGNRSFVSWSSGEESSHTILVLAEPMPVLTARYRNHPPVARIDGNPLRGNFPLRVRMSGERSSDAEGDELSWSWDFGDGSPAVTGRDVEHVYQEKGRYRVSLTVRDELGAEGQAHVWIGGAPRSRGVSRP